ncbi:hypothetical protein [Paludisphaera borealis]|uniref:Uncharacterized protein n=1 Tax=Paludisphaera borealis TaxID=1387353 RepID=A0A1U7CS92_9BACT|nr:hypothetical protein [Paludisphaera borealis]APW61743.1 hypothetical protein BSF38_03271 [Paludisphaera borealis]
MARVTCRCGETIEVASGGPERIVCPRCQTRIRIRRPKDQTAAAAADDGYIRFPCPCGRRLKLRATSQVEAGKCPDCGRVVPIPESARTAGAGVGGSYGARADDPEARTDELDKLDVARLDRWAARHGVSPDAAGRQAATKPPRAPQPPTEVPIRTGDTPPISPPPAFKREAGLRVCPKCRKPLHMSATVCRSCGESTPKT